MSILAPSILNADLWRLGEQIRKVEEAGADWLHVDVMDGVFVPNISMGTGVVESIKGRTRLLIDVHLMVSKPEEVIPAFIKAGADAVSFHIEATPHPHRIVQMIKKEEKLAGIALNPATPLCSIEWLLEEVDFILIMSVNPGYGGQKFISFCLDKISKAKDIIKNKNTKTMIQVDGGIGPMNVKDVIKAGANIIVVGSSIFRSADVYEKTLLIKKLMKEAEDEAGKI